MTDQSGFLTMIGGAKVSFEMLDELNSAVGEHVHRTGGHETDGAIWVASRLFRGRLDPHTTMAVIMRMEALAGLIQSGKIEEWQLPGKSNTGAVLVNAALLHAAAKTPLTLGSSPPGFDLDAFRKIALMAADPEGQA